MTAREVPLGKGIYYTVDAARLLRLHPTRVRRWVKGYTYWRSENGGRTAARARPPVLQRSDLPVLGNKLAVSFLELMEIRVVHALVDVHGIPLQTVRKIATIGRREFKTRYPFATRQIFVEGPRVFASLSRAEAEQIVELTGRRHRQIAWSTLLRPLLQDVDFDEVTKLTRRWWPRGKKVPIVLDPAINFGAPTIVGTRVRTDVVAGMAAADSRARAAWAYSISEGEAAAAEDFERYLAAA